MAVVQEIDELKVYRGQDYVINDKISIHIPTLGEICDYGESDYFSLIYLITATPSDMMWQLDNIGVDFTTIDNFTLFANILCAKTPEMKEEDFIFNKEKTSIIFNDLNLFEFEIMQDVTNNEICLYHRATGNKIDAYTFRLMTECIRKAHFLTEHIEKPANNSTKLVLIEDAKERYLMNKDKKPQSYLLNLISTMVNSEGFKYNHSEVWSMKINAFMDSVKRITKIKSAELLLQSGYSGFGVDLSKINKKQLDWLGAL